MNFQILTLFPEMFGGVIDSSILKRAREAGLVRIDVHNIRDYTTDKHRVTDDTPYGGGPGMVMKPEPIAAAVEGVTALHPAVEFHRVYLSPDGQPWSQELAADFSRRDGILLLCGHYEGIDERARTLCFDAEISLGDFVMTGGEIAAMAVADSVVRLIPGVLGNSESLLNESFGADGLLDCPHFTRPPEFRGLGIPDVLLGGNHALINAWRRQQSLTRTWSRRPDLLEKARGSLSAKDMEFLRGLEQDAMERDES